VLLRSEIIEALAFVAEGARISSLSLGKGHEEDTILFSHLASRTIAFIPPAQPGSSDPGVGKSLPSGSGDPEGAQGVGRPSGVSLIFRIRFALLDKGMDLCYTCIRIQNPKAK